MKTFDRPVQTFVAPELHCALKIHAAREDTTIAAIVRRLIETYCKPAQQYQKPDRTMTA